MMQTELIDATDDGVIVSGVSDISLAEARRNLEGRWEVPFRVHGWMRGSIWTVPHDARKAPASAFYGIDVLAKAQRLRLPQESKDATVNGNVIGGTWTSEWVDADTGKKMFGRGLEFWITRGGRIARWDAVFNWREASK
jgi:hypothetical protein